MYNKHKNTIRYLNLGLEPDKEQNIFVAQYAFIIRLYFGITL